MKHRHNRQMLLTGFALFISIIHFIPFYIALTTALKPKTDLSSRWILPKELYFDNFVQVIKHSNISSAMINSIIITGISIVIIVFLASFAAYPLARYTSKKNKFILKGIVSMMIIPPLSILVPLLSLIKNMGGINSYWSIILVLTTYQLPLATFLFTNFISSTIPIALDESAKMDGAHSLTIYFHIILPLLKPVIATIVILTGVAVWNDYQFALYLLQNPKRHTITLSIASFFSIHRSNFGQAAASTLIAVIPIAMLFVFLQKYFIKGMMEGSIK